MDGLEYCVAGLRAAIDAGDLHLKVEHYDYLNELAKLVDEVKGAVRQQR